MAKDHPRAKRIEYHPMLKLKKAGSKGVIDKRTHRRHFLNSPVACYLPGQNIAHPGFTRNISEEGLSIDFFRRLEPGEDIRLKLIRAPHGSIEILAKVVWINPPTRKGEAYHSGVQIVKISPECKDRLVNLLSDR